MAQVLTQSLVDRVHALLGIRDFKGIRLLFKTQQIADIADVLTSGDISRCLVLFKLVSRSRKPKLFPYLPLEMQKDLLEALPESMVATIVNEMEPDDRTHLLEELPAELQRKILAQLDPDERRVAWRLLSYPEGSVGRLMTPEFLALRSDMTITQALEFIRWSSVVPVEHLHQLFITEQNGKLLGEVGLASLVVADPPSLKVVELMHSTPAFLLPTQEASEAVEAFKKYDRPQMPVVDEERIVIGLVTIDDVFDVAEDEATEDIQQFGGQDALEDSYFLTPVTTMLRKRGGWLAVLFVGQMFTGTALRHYEGILSSMGFLIFFLPLIVSSGGNSGTQTASLILRGLAIKEITHRDWLRVLKREAIMGICLGSFLGVLGYLRAKFWGYDLPTGLAVAVTLICVVSWGAVVGSMLPLLIRKVNLDPAVVSSPFISTLVDVTGIVIFINVAIYLIHHILPSL